MPVVDLSRPIRPGMPAYPGTPDVRFRQIAAYDADGYLERELTCVSHTGTHVDAPAHMLPDGRTLDAFPAAHFIGPACVLDATDLKPGGVLTPLMLDRCGTALERAAFLLIRTGWAARWGEPAYFERIPTLTPPAAERLAALSQSRGGKLRGVGLDVISVDPVGATEFSFHHTLFSADLIIIENLADLSPLPPAGFSFQCLPLPLAAADGAPCRAIATW